MSDLKNYKMVINGDWVDSDSGETFESLNPFTAKPWALIPKGSKEDVDAAGEAAWEAQERPNWPSARIARISRPLELPESNRGPRISPN